jgi:uncharacterized protein YqgC (DUF456 family)
VTDDLVTVLVALAMAVGIAGTIVPILPGLVLVWAAALVYGLATGFGAVGWSAFALITLLGALGVVAGLVLPHRAAGASGAVRWSVWFAFAVGVVGFFVVPIVGLPLGVVLGLFVAELARTRRADAAWRSTWATLKAFGVSALVQVAAGLTMAAVWVAWVLLG